MLHNEELGSAKNTLTQGLIKYTTERGVHFEPNLISPLPKPWQLTQHPRLSLSCPSAAGACNSLETSPAGEADDREVSY